MLDFRIATFLKLCETKSYTKTARVLGITQPSVTQHVKYLQNKYHCKLFVYENKMLRLTPEGEYFRRQAEQMLKMSERVYADLQRMTESQEIRFGFPSELGEQKAVSILAELAKKENGATVSMISGNTAEMLRMLEGGQLDCVLADKLYAEGHYNSQSFAKVHFGGYSGSEHAEINMNAKRLLEEQLLLREEGASDRAVLEHMLHKRDLPFASFSRILKSNVPLSLQALAGADKGVFFTYECAISAEGVVPLRGLGDLSEERSLVILTMKKDSAPEEMSTFIEQFRELWNS
ncbi:MAG TPA: hypothetical protein DCO72_09240 [Ruminococcus sp.]|nr:hypothetical protein [Ruminococcus sp.]